MSRPRKAVRLFARGMEERLRDNDHKGGWESCPTRWLLKRLADELGELRRAVRNHESREQVGGEAADVANFAMMIADNVGALAAWEEETA